MIGKISSGQKFSTAIDYITAVHDRNKKSTLIMHSDGVLCADNKTMAACLEAASLKQGHKLGSPVKHISLSFSPKDAPVMSDELMCRIAADYMRQMGITDTEFVICRHHDKRHPHCHIVFSRVDRHGKVISDRNEKRRNVRVCKLLTQKYGLYFPREWQTADKSRLHGKDLLRHAMAEKVMKCKAAATDWKEFDDALRASGIKLRFHFNNVTGKLMGVTFSDGSHTFSGKQLGASLVLSQLEKEFGNLRELTRDNFRDWYENERERLLRLNCFDRRATDALNRSFLPFESLFPDMPAVDLPKFLRRYPQFDTNREDGDVLQAGDGTGYMALQLMVGLLLQPYEARVPAGGGGGGGGDNDRDRKWKEDEPFRQRPKFHFNYKGTSSRQPNQNKGRRR